MTRRSRRSLAALAVLVTVSGGAGYVWLTREVIYLAASSNTKRIVAAITWNTTVFGMVNAHLVIKDFYGTLYRTLLLRSRDDFFDVEGEFRGLEISDDSVRLHVIRNHYKGPDRFPLPALKEPRVLKR